MPTNVKVCINGFVLSTLLFDCANNSGDQEGFLYGSITRNVRREINDQSLSNTQEDILISICSSVPCGNVLSFYNNVGEINREDLEYSLGDRVENIVGWYRYRRYSAMYPSAREQGIHRNLRTLFASYGNVDDSYFIFGILSSSNLPNFATHSFDYGFFTQRLDETFKNLNLTILNLGDTRNSYRAGSMALPFMNSASFNSVLSSSWNFHTFYESEDQIQQFHQRLRNKLDNLQEELAASDAVNATLEGDIRRLNNEMQSLLATQERLSSAAAAAAARDAQLVEQIVKGSAGPNEKESTDSREQPSCSKEKFTDLKETESTDSQVYDSSGTEELPKVVESVVSSADSPCLKRAAITPVEIDRLTKRACLDKYFESGESHDEKVDDKPVAESADKATSEISSSKQEDIVLSPQVLVVDPDSGEMSAAQSQVEIVKPEVTLCQIQDNLIPSPAGAVEIVISGVGMHRLAAEASDDSATSTSEELSDIKESPDLSDVKESNSESAISLKEASSSPPYPSKTIDSEHQSEMISSTTKDLGDKLDLNESSLSHASSLVRASSSDDESLSKANRPFIIYASKEYEDPFLNPVPSCSHHGYFEFEEAKQKFPSKDKIVPCYDQSESGKKKCEVGKEKCEVDEKKCELDEEKKKCEVDEEKKKCDVDKEKKKCEGDEKKKKGETSQDFGKKE